MMVAGGPQFFLALLAIAISWAVQAQTIYIPPPASPASSEEFVGPFANWMNVKNGCAGGPAAAGNGTTNDTTAFQDCFNALASGTPTLWVPAGTYKWSDVSTTATAILGATSITVASATGIVAGMETVGAGIAGGTQVSVTYTPGSTTVPLNHATTAPLSATSVSFTPAISYIQGVGVVGEDPATTTIMWGSTSSGSMLYLNGVAYSRFNRLTFDGNSHATVAVDQGWDNSGSIFDSGNEYTDDVFRNTTGAAFQCGVLGFGCAETSMLRDTYSANATGISMRNYNALDMWVWYSQFLNNTTALSNTSGAGNFNSFGSIFAGSSGGDIQIGNTGLMTFYGNYSTSPSRFITCASSGNPNTLIVEANTLLNTPSSDVINCGDFGPLILLDNKISKSNNPVVIVGASFGDIFSSGNTFTTSGTCTGGTSPISASRNHCVGDTIGSVSGSPPTLPGTPPRACASGCVVTRTIYEATSGGSGTACSGASPCSAAQAITNAIAAGNKAVAHLQTGSYNIGSTITVPANSSIQIIGDGMGGSTTNLTWTGAANGTMFQLTGPTHVVMRDFYINGASASSSAIVVSNADQPGARVFTEQFFNGSNTDGIVAHNLTNALIELHDSSAGSPPTTGDAIRVETAGTVNLFAGPGCCVIGNLFRITGGGTINVRQYWEDAGNGTGTYGILSGTGGNLSILGMAGHNLTMPSSPFSFSNFTGLSAIMGIGMDSGSESITGTGGATNFSIGVSTLNQPFLSDTATGDTYEYLDGTYTSGCSPSCQATETGNASNLATSVSAVLAPLRASTPTTPIADLPAGVTDIRLYRVQPQNSIVALKVSQ